MIFLHVRFENFNDNSFSNLVYSVLVNVSSMSDDLQITVIVVDFKTLKNNENLTFHEYLLLMTITLKDELMLQTFHQTIECEEIDTNLLSK